MGFQVAYVPIGVGTFHLESAQDQFEKSVAMLKGLNADCTVPEKMLLTINDLDAYLDTLNPDLIVLQNITFANAAYASEVLKRFACPIVLWTLREPVIDGTRLRLNSLTGAYSAGNAITAFRGEGKFEYIFGAPGEDEVVKEVGAAIRAAKVKYDLRRLKMISIGHTPQGFGFGRALDAEMMSTFGTTLDSIEARELINKAKGYTEEELAEAHRQQEENKENFGYYGKYAVWRDRPMEDIEAELAKGTPYVVRFRSEGSIEHKIRHEDLVKGKMEVTENDQDVVILKSDGIPTYHFAHVVDDHLMGITHVVRGNEYLSSAPKYNRLYEAFGWEVPAYIHCPIITDEEHKKLSKRRGDSSFEDLVELGFLPEAIVNYVALLGWSPADDREIFSLKELEEVFDYHRINKSPAVFDIVKLRWMNGEYIKAMSDDAYYEHALPIIKKVITKDLDLKKIADLVKTRIEVFPDITEKIDFFEELPEYDVAMYTHKKMKTNSENSLEVLNEMLPRLEALPDFSFENVEKVVKDYVAEKECKNGLALWPLRTAVSGKQMTPGGAYEIMDILGKEESLKRIRKGIELLNGVQ